MELYEIVQITGWSPDVIDAQPGRTLDELRAVHHTFQRARKSQN